MTPSRPSASPVESPSSFADPEGILSAMSEGYRRTLSEDAWLRGLGHGQDAVRAIEGRLRSAATTFLRANAAEVEADLAPKAPNLDWYRSELAAAIAASGEDGDGEETVCRLLAAMLRMAAEAAREYGKPAFAAGVEGVLALLADSGSREVMATIGERFRTVLP